MRTIKFRAWDKKYKDIIDVDVNSLYHVFSQPGQYILMQFTGLKDKNGKEIYEGDILEDKEFYFMSAGESGIVSFRNGSFDVETRELSHHKYIPVSGSSEWKIIGNIYENPELL